MTLEFASRYYNHAARHGRQVTINNRELSFYTNYVFLLKYFRRVWGSAGF
jgi:hypothetical protein